MKKPILGAQSATKTIKEIPHKIESMNQKSHAEDLRIIENIHQLIDEEKKVKEDALAHINKYTAYLEKISEKLRNEKLALMQDINNQTDSYLKEKESLKSNQEKFIKWSSTLEKLHSMKNEIILEQYKRNSKKDKLNPIEIAMVLNYEKVKEALRSNSSETLPTVKEFDLFLQKKLETN